MLRGFQKMMLGNNTIAFTELTKRENILLAFSVFLVILLGIYPHVILQLIQTV